MFTYVNMNRYRLFRCDKINSTVYILIKRNITDIYHMWCIYMLTTGVVLWRKCACFSVRELELVVVHWLLGGDQAEGWGCRNGIFKSGREVEAAGS